MGFGNKPVDGGHYLFTPEGKDAFLAKEPGAEGLFMPWVGAREFLNGGRRYCLFLRDVEPGRLKALPEVGRVVSAVRGFRLGSGSGSTRALAGFPTRFHVENRPGVISLAFPRVTSSSRAYIPIGFLKPTVLAGDIILAPGCGVYRFGALSSAVHMAWVRIVCGRLGTGFRYSIGVVYNNFPWPSPSPKRFRDVEGAARAVLAVRRAFPDSTLAALYGPASMPDRLATAHRALDRAVAGGVRVPGRRGRRGHCGAADGDVRRDSRAQGQRRLTWPGDVTLA
jgi:hypothetical protein